MVNDLLSELAYDIMANTDTVTIEQAKEVVKFLNTEGILDYDVLKEYYSDDA